MIVRISNKYSNADVWAEKDGEQVNGKSIMSLMMLAAGKGPKSNLRRRQDAKHADEIANLFERKFDEE
ncbi:MAG: HPr family phosphocarrier protein [Bacilli bacterium]